MRNFSKWPFLILFSITAGCHTVGGDWERAKTEDSIRAYEQYIKKYPESPHLQEAKDRIAALHWPPFPPAEELKEPVADDTLKYCQGFAVPVYTDSTKRELKGEAFQLCEGEVALKLSLFEIDSPGKGYVDSNSYEVTTCP
jgi:hypothetical protein